VLAWRLVAHQKVETCAKCHRDIDPLGLALENDDAIGGWRTSYLGDQSPIDVTATMPGGNQLGGNQLGGAESIRRMLRSKPEVFTRCLLTKLLEYGAGRKLSVGDQLDVDKLVASAPANGYRFQDLIVIATTRKVLLAK
jgi:hypothetical protein